MGGGVVGSLALMGHGLLLAFMLGTGGLNGHFGRCMLKRRRRCNRHRMTQLADDQAGHQQENQRPALPQEFTHGARVQAGAATCNDAGIKSRSVSEGVSYKASDVSEKQRWRALTRS